MAHDYNEVAPRWLGSSEGLRDQYSVPQDLDARVDFGLVERAVRGHGADVDFSLREFVASRHGEEVEGEKPLPPRAPTPVSRDGRGSETVVGLVHTTFELDLRPVQRALEVIGVQPEWSDEVAASYAAANAAVERLVTSDQIVRTPSGNGYEPAKAFLAVPSLSSFLETVAMCYRLDQLRA